jgi:hypothetical protein
MVKRNCDQAYNMTFIKSNIKQHNELSLRTWHVLINYIKQHNKVEAIDPAQGNNIYIYVTMTKTLHCTTTSTTKVYGMPHDFLILELYIYLKMTVMQFEQSKIILPTT